MSSEREEFEKRIHKREDECWELLTKEGRPYQEKTVPLWKWRGRHEIITHAAARLLGTILGPLTVPLRKFDQVKSLKTCIKFCVNPEHLDISRIDSIHQNPKLPSTPTKHPPPPLKDAEGNIIGPSPVYVMVTPYRPMLDENKDRQNRPKVDRPGFAGKHPR